MGPTAKITVTPEWVNELALRFPATTDGEWPDRIFVPANYAHSAIIIRLELSKLYTLLNKDKPVEELIQVVYSYAPFAEEDSNIGIWTEDIYDLNRELFAYAKGYKSLINYLNQLRESWIDFAYNYN